MRKLIIGKLLLKFTLLMGTLVVPPAEELPLCTVTPLVNSATYHAMFTSGPVEFRRKVTVVPFVI